MIWTSIRYWLGGRKSISADISAAKRKAKRERGNLCVITGRRAEEEHHLFDVSTWPMFADKTWNLRPMTREKHRAYHRWMGGTHVSTTPISFYRWAWFVDSWDGWPLALFAGWLTYAAIA